MKQMKVDEERMAELHDIFRSFDRNKDGAVTQLELGSLLRSLGLKPNADELKALIHEADTNNCGMIEFSEFVALVSPDFFPDNSTSLYNEEQLLQLFRMFDRNGDGYITAPELADSMEKLGHALTPEELAGMIEEADVDGDGQISFQEFSHAISSVAFHHSWD